MRTDCTQCLGERAVSEGPYNGRWYKHCFRCGWVSSEEWSQPLREAPRRRYSGLLVSSQGEDLTKGLEEPTEAMLAWLGRYGVSWESFVAFGGSVRDGRLRFVCPAFEALRDVRPGARPKWLTKIVLSPSRATLEGWGWGQGDTVLITEDSMAALKAAMAGGKGFPLLGTNSKALSPSLFQGRRIRVLTDPDRAGMMAGRKLAWLLRGMDIKIISGKEPKEYSLDELRGFL